MGARLESQRGVQQGDPLGPLLFSLALQITIENVKARAHGQCPGYLDFMVFYLDDGTLAGPDDVVWWYCRELEKELESIGLAINWGPGKSEAVFAAGEQSQVNPQCFPGLQINASRNFELLKVPIGSEAFCETLIEKRRQAAQKLNNCLSELEDPQVALILLKQCASFCKMSYNLRTVPLDLQRNALELFDQDVRSTFAAAVGVRPDDETWKRVCRPVSFGGLGLRRTQDFADIAFVCSLGSCSKLASAIDPAFRPDDNITSAHGLTAVHRINARLPAHYQIQASFEDVPSQKELTAKVERVDLDADLLSNDVSTSLKAHLQLVTAEGSGAWLHANPSKESNTCVDAPLFRICIKRRLRIPVLEEPSHCPACGAGLDIFGDHALVCMCKGDRTLRHNALRDAACKFAKMGALHPVMEKPGLLPPRPETERIKENVSSRGRRPADIWMPHWADGGAVALDFAVTSGLRADFLHATAIDHSRCLGSYEDAKREYLQTAAQCLQQGILFIPMVAEAHGGSWGPAAKQSWKFLAKELANNTGVTSSMANAELAQRMSISLQRENARAILRRLGPMGEVKRGCNSAAWLPDDDNDVDL